MPDNRPDAGAFKQQRLPAWQPILSPYQVTGCFWLVAVVFLPIGFSILFANSSVIDLEFKYNNIRKCTPSDNEHVFSYTVDGSTTYMGCLITVAFDIPQQMKAPVYLYYKLTNFYQNHRRYVKSRNDLQLSGSSVDASSMDDSSPFVNPGESLGVSGSVTVNGEAKQYNSIVYSPSGLIAWSMFNDSFTMFSYNETKPLAERKYLLCNGSDFYKHNSKQISAIPQVCRKEGIAWESDRTVKFLTPEFGSGIWTAKKSLYFPFAQLNDTNVYPVTNNAFYRNGWYANESGHQVPVNTDEDLMIWMRTASLPSFRKLYRVFTSDLKPGRYHMDIVEQYDVSPFDGEKAFALATTSWVGGKNEFLATAYIVVGALAFIGGFAFLLIHKLCGDRSEKAIEDLMNELK